jgi:hypothetical protein
MSRRSRDYDGQGLLINPSVSNDGSGGTSRTISKHHSYRKMTCINHARKVSEEPREGREGGDTFLCD